MRQQLEALTPLWTHNARPNAALLFALAVQIAYWYLGTPGPQLLRGAEQSLGAALGGVLWAVALFLVLPFLFARVLGLSLEGAGFGLGNARFGFSATLLLALLLGGLLFSAAADPALQRIYPWPGAWPAAGLGQALLWSGLYSLYYLSFEFFYRGFLLRGLEPYWGLGAAVWVQLLASVLIHLGKPLTETLAAIPGGLVFALLAVRGRSLLYPFLLHLFIGLCTDFFSLYHQGLL